MTARQRLALDATIFVLIIVCAYPGWTGIALHEWIGIALVVPALVHLILNWRWVEHVIIRVAEKVRAASVVNLVVDAALFMALVAVTLSGVMVMPELTAAVGLVSSAWLVLHHVSADLTVLALLVHLAMHGRWIAGVVTRTVAPRRRHRGIALRPAPMTANPYAERSSR